MNLSIDVRPHPPDLTEQPFPAPLIYLKIHPLSGRRATPAPRLRIIGFRSGLGACRVETGPMSGTAMQCEAMLGHLTIGPIALAGLRTGSRSRTGSIPR
jgi:hypothetical protein